MLREADGALNNLLEKMSADVQNLEHSPDNPGKLREFIKRLRYPNYIPDVSCFKSTDAKAHRTVRLELYCTQNLERLNLEL